MRHSYKGGVRGRAPYARLKEAATRLCLLTLLLALVAPALLVGSSPARAQVRKVLLDDRERPRKAAPVKKPPVRRIAPGESAEPAQPQALESSPAVAPQAVATPQEVATPQAEATPSRPVPMPAAKITVTTVNFGQLAQRQARAARVGIGKAPPNYRAVHPPLTLHRQGSQPAASANFGALAPSPQAAAAAAPPVTSPTPTQSFLAQEDGPKVGTTTDFIIPPDTVGAVGLDKVFTQTNANYRIHDKATGAALSTVSIDAFWSGAGAGFIFDPKVVYDPYNNRWLLAAVADAQSSSSSILVAVSDTSDPQGSYHIYRIAVSTIRGNTSAWADFPMLGFSKNWLAVSSNLFSNLGNFFLEGRVLFFNYPALLANTVNAYATGGISEANGGFCLYPATTLSRDETTLYMVAHQDSASATYRVSTISGTTAAPVFTVGSLKTRSVNGQGGWTQPDGDILPQTCLSGCPANLRFIDAGDDYIRSNVVFRNGRLYYPQTVGIGASPGAALTHTAAQWTVLDAATGNALDGGRVEDPTATSTNGGNWYAYPSIGVNRNGDIMLGFSNFESDDFADAAYAFRLSSDAPGTMRDPVVYKEGEDYYEKTFGSGRNRWGDYSHTVVDPSNDRDLWTIQEYAQARVPPDADPSQPGNDNVSRWGTWWAKVTAPAGPGDLLISEFRLAGKGGADDEFVEIYNNNDNEFTVATADNSAGYALVASDGVTRFTIPTGTRIPARGHYLGTGPAYSLALYPAGPTTTATGDSPYPLGIPLNAGIALFNTSNTSNFNTGTRLDAAGSTAEPNPLYREGAGYAPITASNPSTLEHSFYRDQCGKGGSLTQPGQCPTFGLPRDTNDNATDFLYVEVNGANAGPSRRLGAPGPENLSSPVLRNSQIPGVLLDTTVGNSNPPNRVRNFTQGSPLQASLGTLEIRRRFINNTGSPVTRLRFRIIDVTTYPSSISNPGTADLRAITSTDVTVTDVRDPATCGAPQTPPAAPTTPPCTVTVRGTALEEASAPGLQQPNGGGFNSSLTVTLPTSLAPGASINVRFVLGVQASGSFKFFVNAEALP